MSHQLTFVDCEFSGKRRKTRKEIFLARMDALLPWSMMLGVIDPVYPKAGNGSRPYPLDTMLRIHCSNDITSATAPWKMRSTRLPQCVGLLNSRCARLPLSAQPS